MRQGTIEWVEIPAPDVEASARFYESVFGWRIQRDQPQGYVMFQEQEGGIGGGFDPRGKPARDSGALLYITVDSIEETARKIVENGGTMVKGRTQISPEVGWWATFRDPGGNTLGLWERAPR